MSELLDTLKDKVTAQGTVIDSAITLLEELNVLLTAANGDPVKIQEIIDMVDAQTQELADAVVANTPVTPTP